MSREEGIIKFQCDWKKTKPFSDTKTVELIRFRQLLFKKKWIGCYPDGIGYGNLSCRKSANTFYISGSATGDVESFGDRHISIVTEFELQENQLKCMGPVKASSESLSHAVIYQSLPEVQAVIHIHNGRLWKNNLFKAPTTPKSIPYGTPQMAEEIKTHLASNQGVIIMGGHEEGIIAYGPDFTTSYSLLEELDSNTK